VAQKDTKKIRDLIAGRMSTNSSSSAKLGAGLLANQPIEEDSEQLGSIISHRYQLLEYLGEGGMGTVFKALQLSTGREVALKMMRADAYTREARERFHLEAKVASRLNHPNAAAIYDFGDTTKNQLFLAMEFIDGVGLDRLLEESGQFEVEEVVEIFVQICELLSEAHANGIIHRDLKPTNILLTQTRKGDLLVKVLDFGIAKQADTFETQSLTQPGEVLGSPRYMSPEQCLGEKVTPATDIYSAGCMLYELLLGVPPHLGADGDETMALHCTERPAKFHKVRPDLEIPLELEQITLRSLNRKPEDRFPSVDEFGTRLKGFLAKQRGEKSASAFKKVGTYLLGIPVMLALTAALFFAAARFSVGIHPPKPSAPPAVVEPKPPGNDFLAQMQAAQREINTHPNNPSGYYAKGKLLMDSNRQLAIGAFSDAIPLAEQMLFADDKDLSARHIAAWASQDRAYLLLLDHNYSAAIRDLSRAIQLRPKYKINYLNRAKAYLKIDKPELAKLDFDKAKNFEYSTSGMDGFEQK
jgi:serine/threonine protein kinase